MVCTSTPPVELLAGATLAPSSASGGASAPPGGRTLGSGLGGGSVVVNGEGSIGGHGWAAPARRERVGAKGCGMVHCLAADALKLLVSSSGNSDSKVFGEEFKAADGFCPTEEFVQSDWRRGGTVDVPEGLLLGRGDRDAEASHRECFNGFVCCCVVHSFSCEEVTNVGGTVEGALDNLGHLHGAVWCVQ